MFISVDSLSITQPGCQIDERWAGRTAVLSVSGVLDMVTHVELDRAIADVLAERPEALVVDITGVNFLGSHGMNALVAAHYRSGSDIPFRVVATGPVTARPLTLTGIDEIISVRPTLRGAMIGLAA
jgi:anti-sigma B factor antagonist